MFEFYHNTRITLAVMGVLVIVWMRFWRQYVENRAIKQRNRDRRGDVTRWTSSSSAWRSLAFYRATLCVSAVFAVCRCLSVRLSVTLVVCINRTENSVKFFLGPVASTF